MALGAMTHERNAVFIVAMTINRADVALFERPSWNLQSFDACTTCQSFVFVSLRFWESQMDTLAHQEHVNAHDVQSMWTLTRVSRHVCHTLMH